MSAAFRVLELGVAVGLAQGCVAAGDHASADELISQQPVSELWVVAVGIERVD